MAQSVQRPTSAQVMISHFMGSSPVSGSALTAQSLEPALDSVSPSLSALPLTHTLSLSKINKHYNGIRNGSFPVGSEFQQKLKAKDKEK